MYLPIPFLFFYVYVYVFNKIDFKNLELKFEIESVLAGPGTEIIFE